MNRPSFELRGESGSVRTLVQDTWAARHVIRALARRDFFVQYRRASLGIAWAAALPLLQAGVLAVIVPRFAAFEVEGSYLAFAFSGTLVWQLFSASVTQSAGSIADNSTLSSRIYFPRIAFPLQTVLSRVYGFLPSLALLVVITAVVGEAGPELVVIVPATALAVVLTSAFSAVFAALHVYSRDVRYLVQAAMIGWFYVTPIIYPLEAVPQLVPWLNANPVTGVVQLYRLATTGAGAGWAEATAWTCGWTAVLSILALVLYRRYDRVFVDRL